jgi:hypothetical protein
VVYLGEVSKERVAAKLQTTCKIDFRAQDAVERLFVLPTHGVGLPAANPHFIDTSRWFWDYSAQKTCEYLGLMTSGMPATPGAAVRGVNPFAGYIQVT